ncbi:sulfatase-like hydrolase/transferase [Streptomyces sp. NBC_01089]|uniref:sulfatase-like hydrolase/transferase n=1 Tax=Streptomyces sp. NBC_01089 TaxID=2903747 RepID=UPI003864526B|nr:sulfatase-like hydrolase/transferase [Streptomyces sp. NBC_01089]
MSGKRPNFVFFIPDQLRADALGAFGNPHISTPHLDALAALGTRFDNAYVQHPVCSPSRASFLTGWYPHTQGHRTLTHLLKPWEPNLLRCLKEAGYHVAWPGMRGDTFAPGATELSVDEYGFGVPPTAFGGPAAPGDWPGGEEWARLHYRGRLPDDSERVSADEATIRTAVRWLEQPPEGPWALFVPLIAPHCPFEAEEPWFSLYDRATLPAPVPPAGAEGPEPAYMQAVRERFGIEDTTPEMWREVKATYYGMISRMDEQLGRLMAAVDGSGAGESTVTLFFADHGEYLGDYGLVEKWPSALHPCITRDPLVISGGGLPRGGRTDAMVELIDVLPTVLELAGVEAPHRHFGHSLVPLIHDTGREHREYAFTEGGFSTAEEPRFERAGFPYDLKAALQHERPELVGRAVAVRDREWTYVWRLYEPAELYHRPTDPDERVSLAGSPVHAHVEQRMNQALLRWLADTADVIPADEDPRYPSVDLPVPAGRAGPDGTVERASQQLARALARWKAAAGAR